MSKEQRDAMGIECAGLGSLKLCGTKEEMSSWLVHNAVPYR